MEQRTKRDSSLISLVSEFEANFENGNVEYLNEKSFFQLIKYYEDDREYEKALDVAKLALEQYRYRSDFYISLCRLYLKLNKINDCLTCLEIAESIAPYENEIIILKVRALALSGDYELAFNELECLKTVSLKGDLVEVYLCEAEIYAEMSCHQQMFDSLKEALELESSHIEALERFWVSTELSKRYIECADYMSTLIDKNPYNYFAWYNLGHALSFSGEYEKAIDAIEYSFIINPDFEEGYMECADLCCQIKDYGRALKVYQEAIDYFGEDNDLLINISECQMYLNKTADCKNNLYKAVKQDPYNDEIYYYLAECYSKEEKWYSAINAYHKAIEIEDGCGEYYLGLARAYVAVEDYNKATINFHLSVSDGPEQTHFWREFASFLLKLGLYNESLQILDEAEEYTFGADLLYCRAMVNFFLKNKKTGLRILEEALVEDFSLHTIIYSLAPEFEVDKEISSMIEYFAGE
ncbi:MAG: tetratricopeptide repeat protein [Bacteroidota bacterium]